MRPQEKRLTPPRRCDECKSESVEFVRNDVVYGRVIGNWPFVYYCRICYAIVGCHAGTNEPLGRMANAKTRKMRSYVHQVFDRIWREHHMRRQAAYAYLAGKLSIAVEDCHISWLTDEQLAKAAEVSEAFLKTDNLVKLKRDKKRNAKHAKRAAEAIEGFHSRKKRGLSRHAGRGKTSR